VAELANRYDSSAAVINASVAEHHCFGCGDQNPIGLQLRFRALRGADGVWSSFTPDRRYEGYFGLVHGGILSALLDEAMSWAITASGSFAVTARMQLAFRSPASIGRELRVEGRIKADRTRVVDTAGRVMDVASESVVAEAEARFVRVTEEQAAAWREAYRSSGARTGA
jgi:uncharacterized protein (TIGR00369 family)